MMNWKTPTLTDLETLQKCAATNGFFANVYGAVNCVLYAKKFSAQIALEGGWLFLRLYEDQKPRFFFPHKIDGGLEGAEEALKLLKKEARGFLEADSRFEKDVCPKDHYRRRKRNCRARFSWRSIRRRARVRRLHLSDGEFGGPCRKKI